MSNNPDDIPQVDADEGTNEPPAVDADSAEDGGSEVQQLQDRVLRVQAELENFRRRSQRERQAERKYACQNLLVDLLPVIDNMERAIEAAQQASDTGGLLEGFRMVHQLLLQTLEKHDCVRVLAEGVNFDPTLHEAIAQTPSDDVPKGQVVAVHQQGYQLHDRVIRPAQVVVSAGPNQAEA